MSAFGAHRDSDASEQNPPVSEDDTTLAEIEANAVASEALTLHIEGALLTLEEVNLSREVYRLLSDRASLVFAAARALSRDDGAHFVSWARFKGLVLQGMGVAAGIEDGTEPRTGRTESRTDRTERNSGRAEQRNAGIKDGTGPRTRWTALRTGRTERKTGRAEQRNAGTSGTDSDSEEESARGEASPERSPLSSGLSDRRTRVSISDAANATSDATGEVPYGHLQNFAEQLELFRRNRESSGRAESLVERLTSFLLDRLAARLTSAEARSLGGAVTGRLLAAEGFGGNNEWEWIASRGLCARAGGSAGITDISTTSTEEVDKGEAKRLGTIIMENKRKSELVSGEQGGIEMGTLAKGGGTSEKERPSPAKAAQISRLAELQQEFPGRPNPFAVALKVLEGTLGRLTENKDETLAEPVTGIAPEKLPTFADYLAACKAEPATEKLGILQQVALFQALYPDALPSALAWLSATLLGAPTDLDADSDVSTDAESDVIRGGVESGEVPEESPRAGLEPRQLTLSGISDVTWRGEVGVPPEKRNRKTSAKRALRLVKQALGETSVERPLVVVRATSGFAVIDVINRLARLEEIPSDVIATVCLGQNHGGEAEEAIYTAQRSGGWVCILGLETESEWSNRLCELVYEVAGGKSYVHPTCRLWVHYQLCRSDVERRVESNCEELGRPLPEGFLAGTTCNVVCIG